MYIPGIRSFLGFAKYPQQKPVIFQWIGLVGVPGAEILIKNQQNFGT